MDVPMLQLSFIWEAKEHTSSRHEGRPTQKSEEKPLAQFWLLFLCFFFLPLSLSHINWASQEGCLFYLRFLLQSSDLSLFYSWAFPFFIFQPPPFWTPFSYSRTSLVAQTVKRLSTMQETRVQALGWEDPLEKEWQPTPVLLPGKSLGQGACWTKVYGVAKSRTRLSDFTFTFTFLF